MREFKILFLFLVTVFAVTAYAYVVPVRTDLKPASQVMIEHQRVGTAAGVATAPEVADDDQVLASNDGPTAATVKTITTFTAQPDVPRNITIIPGSTTANVEACDVTVTGTNILGATITETLSFLDNASTATAGAKAFASVTSVSWAADCEATPFQATWKVGVGDVLGLKRCMKQAGDVVMTVFDGVYEGTRATCVADADEVEKNTCDINGTLNGSKLVDFYFIQNFACLP